MPIEQIDFNEYKHRYAIWTAARAVQRSFTTTKNISEAIKHSDLRNFAEKPLSEKFEDWHPKCSMQLMAHLQKLLQGDKSAVDKITYGRAAKIIAIYLKTSVVCLTEGSVTNVKLSIRL